MHEDRDQLVLADNFNSCRLQTFGLDALALHLSFANDCQRASMEMMERCLAGRTVLLLRNNFLSLKDVVFLLKHNRAVAGQLAVDVKCSELQAAWQAWKHVHAATAADAERRLYEQGVFHSRMFSCRAFVTVWQSDVKSKKGRQQRSNSAVLWCNKKVLRSGFLRLRILVSEQIAKDASLQRAAVHQCESSSRTAFVFLKTRSIQRLLHLHQLDTALSFHFDNVRSKGLYVWRMGVVERGHDRLRMETAEQHFKAHAFSRWAGSVQTKLSRSWCIKGAVTHKESNLLRLSIKQWRFYVQEKGEDAALVRLAMHHRWSVLADCSWLHWRRFCRMRLKSRSVFADAVA
jgi:hypothetical protein